LHPPEHGDVVDLNPAFDQQFLHVAIGKVEPQIPAHRHHNHLRREPEPGERRLRRRPWQGPAASFTGQACLDRPIAQGNGAGLAGTFVPREPGRCLMTRDTACLHDRRDGSFRSMEAAMSKVIVKVGGVAAVLAGVLVAGEEVWGLAVGGINEGMAESAVHSTWVLLLVFGVLGLHLHQQQAAGRFGQIATLAALFGTVTLFALALTEVTILPALPADSPLVDKPPPAMLVMFFVSFAAYIVGLLMFGIATWQARVLPRRAAALLVIGMLLALAGKSFIPGVMVFFGLAWIWLGAATVRQSRIVENRPVPTVFERA
jgi:hypothetical protein